MTEARRHLPARRTRRRACATAPAPPTRPASRSSGCGRTASSTAASPRPRPPWPGPAARGSGIGITARPVPQRRADRDGDRHAAPDVRRPGDRRRSGTACRSGWPRSAPGRHRPMTLLREHVTALRALLHGETVTTEGRYVQLDGVKLDWPPDPAPELLVGATGPKTLRLSGELAGGTVLTGGTHARGRPARRWSTSARGTGTRWWSSCRPRPVRRRPTASAASRSASAWTSPGVAGDAGEVGGGGRAFRRGRGHDGGAAADGRRARIRRASSVPSPREVRPLVADVRACRDRGHYLVRHAHFAISAEPADGRRAPDAPAARGHRGGLRRRRPAAAGPALRQRQLGADRRLHGPGRAARRDGRPRGVRGDRRARRPRADHQRADPAAEHLSERRPGRVRRHHVPLPARSAARPGSTTTSRWRWAGSHWTTCRRSTNWPASASSGRWPRARRPGSAPRRPPALSEGRADRGPAESERPRPHVVVVPDRRRPGSASCR